MPPKGGKKTKKSKRQPSAAERRQLASFNAIRPDAIPMIVKPHLYTIARSWLWGQITATKSSGEAATIANGINVSLSDFPSPSDFTNLFDAFRFLQVSVVFTPYVTQATSAATFPGFLHTIIDYDDASIPTDYSVLEQNDTYRKCKCTEVCTRTFSPGLLVQNYLSLSTTGYSGSGRGSKAPWVDIDSAGSTSSASLPWYGLKFLINDTQVTGSSLVYRCDITAVMQFRAPS